MKMQPSLEEVKKISEQGSYDVCPLCMKIERRGLEPTVVAEILMNVSSHCFLLESAEQDRSWGRYSFLGYDPKLSVTCKNGHMVIGGLKIDTDDPNKYIRQVLEDYRGYRVPGFPTFTGGLVGYFSYDYLKYAEPTLKLDAKDTEDFQDVDLMLFDKVIVFDNYEDSILLISNIRLEEYETSYNKAAMELEGMRDLILKGARKQGIFGRLVSDIRPMFDKERFCAMVEKAKGHIREGDIFQIVLSNRLEADFEGSLLPVYNVLRRSNPSPYMFYFSGSDMEVAGASPETLVKLEDGIVHTFPLAGTRRRGKTPEEDLELEKDLLADEKELAEHNMLVDLGRNDIGKISKFGTVHLEKYHSILRFSHVMHIGSTVCGEIRDGVDALDTIDSILPAGTLSGAPKIRACQLINDLEDNKRGIYGGAIGYIDFSGNLDTAIAIRIAYKKNGKVFVRSGAGIVADSVPESEYQESLNKAMAVIDALKRAEGSN